MKIDFKNLFRKSPAQKVAAEIRRIITSGGSLDKNPKLPEMLEDIKKLDKSFDEHGGVFFHAGSSAFETAEKFTQIHVEQYRTTGRPSLPALAMHFAEALGADKNSPEYKALILIAVRAEMKMAVEPDYHSKFHYTDVAAMVGNLLIKNNEMVKAGNGGVALSIKDQILTLATAIGHDADHEGKGNPKEEQTLNEEKSFSVIAPLMEEAGVSAADIARMHTVLMTTSPNGPHAVMKESAHARREGRNPDFSKVDPKKEFLDLQALAEDPVLCEMAAILSDSDLYGSAGAGAAANGVMSGYLTTEMNKAGVQVSLTNFGARKFFFDSIVGKEGFASHAGRVVGQGMFNEMYEETERALAHDTFNGRYQGGNYHIDCYQSPDGVQNYEGTVRRKARYSKDKGYDSAQQDNAFVLPNAPDLPTKNAVGKLFEKISEDLGKDRDKFSESGATGSVVHISKDGMLTVGHVGDSPVKIYLRDPKSGKITASHLLTPLHSAENASAGERQQIEKAGGHILKVKVVREGRFEFIVRAKDGHEMLCEVDNFGQKDEIIRGAVMLTRSLGDFESKGISDKPDITQHDLKQYWDKGLEAIVVVESDGATEKTKEGPRLKIMEAYGAEQQFNNLSQALVDRAIADETRDNITSVAAVLKAPLAENILMAVFDGHGKHGAEAAHIAAERVSSFMDEDLRAIRPFNADMGEAPTQNTPKLVKFIDAPPEEREKPKPKFNFPNAKK